MESQPSSPQPFKEEVGNDFRKALAVLNKWKLFIVSGALICAAAAGVWVYNQVPVYEANAVLMVKEAIARVPGNSEVSSITGKPLLTMDTYLAQLNSNAVWQMMSQDLDLDRRKHVPGKFSAYVVENTNLISISVENQDPKLAADIANSLSQQFLFLLSDVDRQQTATENISSRAAEAQKPKLSLKLDPNVKIVSKATVPTVPVGPNSAFAVAIALAAGLMLFTLLAFLLDMLDNTLKAPEEAALVLGLPTLGAIPTSKKNLVRM